MPRPKGKKKRAARRDEPPLMAQVLKFLASAMVFTLGLWWCAHVVLRVEDAGDRIVPWIGLGGARTVDDHRPGEGGEGGADGRAGARPVDGSERKPVVVVDAGHGGVDGGTVGHGLIEKNTALQIAERVRDELERRGVATAMTRTGDETLSLLERSAMANRRATRALVSVHLNAGPRAVSGVETFYSDPKGLGPAKVLRRKLALGRDQRVVDGRGRLLAEQVQEAVCAATGARDRGEKNRPELSVTRHTNSPAVLVECGFVTDANEAKKLGAASYQQKLAAGIAEGVVAFLAGCDADPHFGLRIEAAGVPEVEVASAGSGADSSPRSAGSQE